MLSLKQHALNYRHLMTEGQLPFEGDDDFDAYCTRFGINGLHAFELIMDDFIRYAEEQDRLAQAQGNAQEA